MAVQLRGSAGYIWSLNDQLGHGATGAVFKGRCKGSGELCAVKTFNPMSALRPTTVQTREFEVLRKLKHKNIVNLLDVELETGTQSEVIVMELCTGGSLYNMLDDPENAYGVDEKEFLAILSDVASGMRHLHDNGIVHRDIKPGNIMRFIADDGRSVYKLIDFGAARELEQDQEFMSLYGTEEYLFPDMYERAVLRRSSTKQFNATVDLWSLGVTFYHVATGQLPFRPFGGRKNKDTMYKIMTEKGVGVISGVQSVDGGLIEYSRELPASCRLSQGLKRLLTPLLGGLLESEQERMMSFDEFFRQIQSLVGKLVVHVFSVKTCTPLCIYIDSDQQLTQFQELIAEQTDIRADDQVLLYENHDLDKSVEPLMTVAHYPRTSAHNPVYLYCSALLISADSNLPPKHKHAMPALGAEINLDQDMLAAKNCCALAHDTRRTIDSLILLQRHAVRAAAMFRFVLSHELEHIRDVVTQFSLLVDEVSKRVDALIRSARLVDGLRGEVTAGSMADQSVQGRRSDSDIWMEHKESFSRMKQHVVSLKADTDTQYDRLHRPSEPAFDLAALALPGCLDEHRCVNKADVLVTAVKATLVDFQRNRGMKKLSYNEEQIHKFDKHKLRINASKMNSLVQDHCSPNTVKVLTRFYQWFTEVWSVKAAVEKLKSDLISASETEAKLTAELDEVERGPTPALRRTAGVRSPGRTPSTAGEGSTPAIGEVARGGGRAPPAGGTMVNGTDGHLLQDLKQRLAANNDEVSCIRDLAQENTKLLEYLKQCYLTRPGPDGSAAYADLVEPETLTAAGP